MSLALREVGPPLIHVICAEGPATLLAITSFSLRQAITKLSVIRLVIDVMIELMMFQL